MRIKLGDCSRWNRDNGDLTHRINYNLTNNSLVFDIGAARGEWSSKIFEKYNCNIILFEPTNLLENFYLKNHDKIKIINAAAYIKNCKILFSEQDGKCDDPSVFINNKNFEVEAVDFKNYLISNNFKKIDLIKINIEGEEYDLLDDLINNNLIKLFQNIQIQFHIVDEDTTRYDLVSKKLKITHNLTYNYPFVWENWRLND